MTKHKFVPDDAVEASDKEQALTAIMQAAFEEFQKSADETDRLRALYRLAKDKLAEYQKELIQKHRVKK